MKKKNKYIFFEELLPKFLKYYSKKVKKKCLLIFLFILEVAAFVLLVISTFLLRTKVEEPYPLLFGISCGICILLFIVIHIIGLNEEKNVLKNQRRLYKFVKNQIGKNCFNRWYITWLEEKCNRYIEEQKPPLNFLRDILFPIIISSATIVFERLELISRLKNTDGDVEEQIANNGAINGNYSLLIIVLAVILILTIFYALFRLWNEYIDNKKTAYKTLSGILALLKAKALSSDESKKASEKSNAMRFRKTKLNVACIKKLMLFRKS